MSVQMRLEAPATRVASRKLGPVAGRRSPPNPTQRPRRLADQHVGEHVRQVRHGGQDRVVDLGLDRHRPGAQAAQQAVQALVEDPRGRRGRGQIPGGALEQVGAGVLDAGGLRPGERVAAHESRVAQPRPTIARLVEPTSLTTQPAGAASSAAATAAWSPPTGTATNTASASRTASSSSGARVDRRRPAGPRLRARPTRCRSPRRWRRAARGQRARSSRRSARRRRARSSNGGDPQAPAAITCPPTREPSPRPRRRPAPARRTRRTRRPPAAGARRRWPGRGSGGPRRSGRRRRPRRRPATAA